MQSAVKNCSNDKLPKGQAPRYLPPQNHHTPHHTRPLVHSTHGYQGIPIHAQHMPRSPCTQLSHAH